MDLQRFSDLIGIVTAIAKRPLNLWQAIQQGMIMGMMNNHVLETIIFSTDRRGADHTKRALKPITRMVRAIDVHMEGRHYLAGEFTIADTTTGHACQMGERFGALINPAVRRGS